MTKYLKGKINTDYVVEVDIDNFQYQMDWTDKKELEDTMGTSPTGMLIAALAGCNLITAKSYLTKKRYDYEKLAINIEGDFVDEDPYTRLFANITIKTDAKLDSTAVDKLNQHIERYCTVSKVLSETNQIQTKIELL